MSFDEDDELWPWRENADTIPSLPTTNITTLSHNLAQVSTTTSTSTPTNISFPPNANSPASKILETRNLLLRNSLQHHLSPHSISEPLPSLLEEESFRYLWESIEVLMSHVNAIFFTSSNGRGKSAKMKRKRKEASTVVISEIEKFQPRIRGLRRDVGRFALSPQARILLLIELEYAQIFIHSAILPHEGGGGDEQKNIDIDIDDAGEQDGLIQVLVRACRDLIQLCNVWGHGCAVPTENEACGYDVRDFPVGSGGGGMRGVFDE
ncbi:hypothetical protein G7Y89_g12048 [Cudoniella acicularis]|uniref:Uncharacterized protein n=1 Tax=Cudoniella acicularis TaxID=354080 RepID=A0A8H4RB72_9HELO|nr:hypothetical protein G7Y89_g12048 [Cudoniella acicularis]